MFVEPLADKTQQHQDKNVDTEETQKHRGLRNSRSQGLLGTPKPYRMSPTQPASRQSISYSPIPRTISRTKENGVKVNRRPMTKRQNGNLIFFPLPILIHARQEKLTEM